MERDGEIIATSKDSEGIEDLSSYYVESNEWKTEVVLYEKHSLIKEAYRGDNLRVMKTTEVKTDGTDEGNDSVLKKKGSLDSVLKKKVSLEKKDFKIDGIGKNNAKKVSNLQIYVQPSLPALKLFKLKVSILPDLFRKMASKNVGGCMHHCFPPYIKSLLDEVKIAVEQSVLETKQFVNDEYGKLALSVNTVPFYAFTEGPKMISEMENICKSHFDQLVTGKICLVAMKTKPNLKIAEKIGMGFLQLKKWKRAKYLFHQQFKNEKETQGEKTQMACAIS